MAFLLGLLELLHQACEREDSPDRDHRQGGSRRGSPFWAFKIGCSSWNHVPPPTWQQHHYLERITIDPHGEPREGLTIEGMGWVSDRDLTTHSI